MVYPPSTHGFCWKTFFPTTITTANHPKDRFFWHTKRSSSTLRINVNKLLDCAMISKIKLHNFLTLFVWKNNPGNIPETNTFTFHLYQLSRVTSSKMPPVPPKNMDPKNLPHTIQKNNSHNKNGPTQTRHYFWRKSNTKLPISLLVWSSQKWLPFWTTEKKIPSPEAKANLEVEARIRLQALGIAPTLAGAGGLLKNTTLAGC